MTANYQIYDDWLMVPEDKWPWPNFTPSEMCCRGNGSIVVVPSFMDRLQGLRDILGRPLKISSGYRSPEHNAKVSNTGRDGPHTTGMATDILAYGGNAHDILRLAMVAGFSGIGIQQKGPLNRRFIHLDTLSAIRDGARPNLWSY